MSYRLKKKYDALDRLEKWDEVTQSSIKKRTKTETGKVSVFGYLSEEEGRILTSIVDALIPQPSGESYVKIAEAIDRSLNDRVEGVRYSEDAWRGGFYQQGLAAVSEYSTGNCSKPFEKLSKAEHKDFFAKIMEAEAGGSLQRFLRRVLADAIGVYFSHPQVWNKIGFPGPAFPEGYAYLKCGEKEEWEPEYKKYEK
jgi:hypothetical protein